MIARLKAAGIGRPGGGQPLKPNVVACALALSADDQSFKDDRAAKAAFGVAPDTKVRADWIDGRWINGQWSEAMEECARHRPTPPPHTTPRHHTAPPPKRPPRLRRAHARVPHSFWMTWTHYIYDGETYEGWGYFFEQGYETSQALQARLATFLRGTAGWTVAVEQW